MSDQERYEYEVMSQQSAELGELFAALSKAQGQMSGAVKDSSNPFFKSKYADLHHVWEAVRGPLSSNSLTVLQATNVVNNKLFVVTTIGHSSGQWMKSITPVKAMKEDPQAMGSAITYARRYSLAAICGIAQMDDDAESAMSRNTIKGQTSGEKIDLVKINKAAEYIKETINADIEEDERKGKLQAAYDRISNDENLEITKQLNDFAPGTKRKYKNILSDYLKENAT